MTRALLAPGSGILKRMPRLALALLCAFPLFAQSWEPVRALSPGARVKVREKNGTEHKGNVTAVTPDSISVAVGAAAHSIGRAQVARVQAHGKSRRARNIAIGAGIGLAVAVTVDQTLGVYLRNETGDSGRAVTYIAPIALFGAIGAALSPYKTIYRAP
jgi:hypothetical protein